MLTERLNRSDVFNRFRRAWEKGESLVVSGAPGSAPAWLLARVFPASPRPLVVIAAGYRRAERLQGELAGMLGRRVALFPALEAPAGGPADPGLAAERLSIAASFLNPGGEPPVVVTAPAAWEQPLPAPAFFGRRLIRIRVGDTVELDRLLEDLLRAGYERNDPVTAPGQFARRGGIVDVFSGQDEFPVRIEFDGERVESLRRFDPLEQKSVGRADRLEAYPVFVAEEDGRLGDYLPAGCRLVAVEPPDDIRRELRAGAKDGPPSILFFSLPPPGGADLNFSIRSLEKFKYPRPDAIHPLLEAIPKWLEDGYFTTIYAYNEGERDRLREILREKGLPPQPRLELRLGELAEGFVWPEAALAAVSDSEIFSRYEIVRPRREYVGKEEVADHDRFEVGDHVVHADHGIGLYLGVKTIFSGGRRRQALVIKYAEGGRLYVPLTQSHLLTRYLGLGGRPPALDKMGGRRWPTAKARAARAVGRMAAQLLETHAWRRTLSGHRFAPDGPWQKEFEAAFIYPETPDQSRALAEIKEDMESDRPMERLLCGDVGYGKTEVAIRAAFKAVMDGRQVAMMVPTTVLAQQHYYTFAERLADYPVRVEMLSRFVSPAAQREILRDLARGRVDIVIGTSRLVQKDVRFKSLGLVIFDEEQRFGVGLKEELKRRRMLADVLTLTATPIPRTLHLSLSGARDLSTINTPPRDRLAVETRVAPYDPDTARRAIEFELERGGQVYYLHNRIRTIGAVGEKISRWFPGKRVAIGHGRMDEKELAEVMRMFSRGEIDVLVSTTIIESGLDIPNANTIIVENAERFGLADLYQLRGRVGRFKRRAWAYFLYSPWRHLPDDAHRRLRAIEEFSHLGAGFSLALRDLEIRGAGNILGREQHGHISAVGFDLYSRLLRRSVERLKGKKPPADVETRLEFDLAAELPSDYIPDDRQRIEMSRRWAAIAGEDDREEWLAELRDRFGEPPEEAAVLAAAADLRNAARGKGITGVSEEGGRYIFRRLGKLIAVVDPPPLPPAEKLRYLAEEIKKK